MNQFTMYKSFRPIAFALVAGAAFAVTAPSVFAGSQEVAALATALQAQNPPRTAATANSAELVAAFKTVVTTPGSNLTPAVVAGEVLKNAGALAPDIGVKLAAALNTDPALQPLILAKATFVGLAAKTAGSGSGINVTEVPDFVVGLALSEAQALSAATSSANDPAKGAILGGASRPKSDADKITFAISSIATFASATQDIARYIADESSDSALFALKVADANADTQKAAVKIATGAITGDPTNGGNITYKLFGEKTLSANGTPTAPPAGETPSSALLVILRKAGSTIAKGFSAVADIEEIQKIGNALGQQIGTPQPAPNQLKGQIALSKASGYVKALAAAVLAKPRTDRFNLPIAANSDANKADEIAEVAAYVIGGLATSPELTSDPTKAASVASKLFKILTAASGAKAKAKSGVLQGPAQTVYAADVAASFALTVDLSAMPQVIKDAFEIYIKNNVAKISKDDATKLQIANRLTDVYANGGAVGANRFENGNDPAGAVSDPETDIHPFS